MVIGHYSIKRWLKDFDATMDAFKCEAGYRFICMKRLMSGSAETLLRTINVKNDEEFRTILVTTFGRVYSRQKNHEKLSEYLKTNEVTTSGYFINVREIAMNGDISESEMIEYAIRGIK